MRCSRSSLVSFPLLFKCGLGMGSRLEGVGDSGVSEVVVLVSESREELKEVVEVLGLGF